MELGTVVSVAQTLFAAVQCPELRRLFAVFGYQSELDNLRRTVSTVKAVLNDAEAKQNDLLSLSNQAQLFIDELRNAVYDADDLLDEFITIAELRKRHKGDALAEIRQFFSRFNRLNFARKMNKSVAKIRRKLDDIAVNYGQFGFKVDYEPIRVRREETCSYVNEGEIIGRDVDVENLVTMLICDGDDVGCCNFVTVVGIGGLGKTTLAQLVYNDERVKSSFSSRIWACVSDQNGNEFCVKDILVKILKSVTGNNCDHYTMDQVQIEIKKHLGQNKYLLVLDDVWIEDREQWLKLERFLRCGKEGSWVVVTTRSKATARIVGNGVMYKLKGLSLEHSRRLFEMSAFGSSNPSRDFVEIGYQIVDRCANVPLAIRVVGSLLYGQTISKWHSLQQKGLAYLNDDHKNGIKSILKLSYHHLKSPLKSCFSYCAIFPKDFVIEKETLISLWMAQGYIVPFGEGQSLEDAAEECFLILLKRCFFQDVKRDKYGEIVSCKIHDLMHDIAQDVAGKEICEVMSSNNTSLDERVRHLSYVNENLLERTRVIVQIRSCLRVGGKDKELLMGLILSNCLRLRSLTLSELEVRVLPESIGKLLHLRYLDLSFNRMLEELPKTITKLHNLLVLKLFNCCELKELPKDLSKLSKLQTLDISRCNKLKYLPTGMSTLAYLHTLTRYMVGGESMNVKECFDQLEDLKGLGNLKGSIKIQIHVPKNAKYVDEDHSGGSYMRDKKRLNRLKLTINHVENYESVEYEEALLEELQPHSNLMWLTMKGCKCERWPSWFRKENLANRLPNLVRFELVNCEGLEDLPSLRSLTRLRKLKLVNLPKLKYVEIENLTDVAGYSRQLLRFPCLEHVHLQGLPKVKAWLQGTEGINELSDRLPRVKKMVIIECPKLSSTLSHPHAEGLRIFDSAEEWRAEKFVIRFYKSLRSR